MYTMTQIFDAAGAAESAARCLHWAQILKLYNLNTRGDQHANDAVSHVRRLALELGFALTPLPSAPEPAPRTAEALYVEERA